MFDGDEEAKIFNDAINEMLKAEPITKDNWGEWFKFYHTLISIATTIGEEARAQGSDELADEIENLFDPNLGE